MKTLEEVEKFLEEKGIFDKDVFSPTDNQYYYWSELIEIFANAKAKALLEEAAEKIDLKKEPETTWRGQGFNSGLANAKAILRDLQIKQQ